jgi:hypothetical protein
MHYGSLPNSVAANRLKSLSLSGMMQRRLEMSRCAKLGYELRLANVESARE